MAVPTNKAELIEAISRNYAKLSEGLCDVPEGLWHEAMMDGHAKGSRMSAHDLAAYLTGWCELVLKWHSGWAAGHSVEFPETGFKWNELGRLAAKFYVDYAELSRPDLLERLESAKDLVLALVRDADDETLYGKGWYENYTLGRMIQLNTASPFDNARKRLWRWRKENGLA